MAGMDKKRFPPSAIALILFAALCLGYIVSYFLLGTTYHDTGPGPPYISRIFDYSWQERLYEPAAKVESWFIGGQVVTGFNKY